VPAGIRTVEPVTETDPAIPASPAAPVERIDDEDTQMLPTRTPAAVTPTTTTFTPTAKAEDTQTIG
jgi:hypothetical protein